MYGIVIAVINIFLLFLILNERILTGKIGKWKYILAFFNLLISLGAIAGETWISGNEIAQFLYYAIVIEVGVFFVYEVYAMYLISTMKNDYYQLFIKTLKDMNKQIFLVTDEKDRVKEISTSLITDLGFTKEQVMNRKWMELVYKELTFRRRNEHKIDNNLYEQHYLKYNATYKSQKSETIEYEYLNAAGEVVIIQCVEKPIIKNNRFKGRILVGEKITLDFLQTSKKEVEELKSELIDLQARFQTTLSLLKEGLYYMDEKTNAIWGTDSFKQLLGLATNTIHQDDLKSMIHPSDLDLYEKQMELKTKKHKYRIHYRVIINQIDKWILEEGESIETPEGRVTVAALQEANSRIEFNKLTFLDDLDYRKDIKKLTNEQKPFWILRFNISSTSELYVKYGREAATHAIQEFLKKIKKQYHARTNKMYELAHLEFAIVLTDHTEFQVIKKGLLSDSDLFKYETSLGGVKASFTPEIGIISYPDDETDFDELLKGVEKAVHVATSKVSRYHYCFYGDIHDIFS